MPADLAARVDAEDLAATPEPSRFADLRIGQHLPPGPAELEQTATGTTPG